MSLICIIITKKCNICNIEKEFKEFSKDKTTKDKCQRTCKNCCADYRILTKDKRSIYGAKYYLEHKGNERKKTYDRVYAKTHKIEKQKYDAEYKPKHKIEKQKYDIEYAIAHKLQRSEKFSQELIKNSRRLNQLTARAFVTFVIKPYILKRDKYLCQLCNRTNNSLNIHHIIPINQNNTQENILNPFNLVTLCNKCHIVIAHMGCTRKIDATIAIKLSAIVKAVESINPTNVPEYKQKGETIYCDIIVSP